MNRHFQSYAALPCEPLGKPIRKQPEKPSPETPWKPIPGHPDHVERINAQGVREVTHKDWVPAPPPPPAPAAPALDPGRVMPEDVHGSCLADVPEGATHRCCIYGTFYRHIKTGETYTWGPNGWQEAYCRWSDETMAGSGFERLPQPAAPTEWQSGPPSEKGWFKVRGLDGCIDGDVAYFFGERWGYFIRPDAIDLRRWTLDEVGPRHCTSGMQWRGPRLTGADWPEPQQ